MNKNLTAKDRIYNLPESFLATMKHSGERLGSMPGLVCPSTFRGSWIAIDFIDLLRESASVGIPWPELLIRKVVVDMVREEPVSGTLVCYLKYAHMLKIIFLSNDESHSGGSHSLFSCGRGYLGRGKNITRPVIIRPIALWDSDDKATALWPAAPDGCCHEAGNPMVLDAGNFLDYSCMPMSCVTMPANVDGPGSDRMSIPIGPLSMFQYEELLYVYRNRWFSYPR